MANIQIADLAEVENQFDELSDLELEVVGGFIYRTRYGYASQAVLGGLNIWFYRPSLLINLSRA
ncbi:MAG: hypothetical protein ACKPFK_27540 [Dolichospermum sp.]